MKTFSVGTEIGYVSAIKADSFETDALGATFYRNEGGHQVNVAFVSNDLHIRSITAKDDE